MRCSNKNNSNNNKFVNLAEMDCSNNQLQNPSTYRSVVDKKGWWHTTRRDIPRRMFTNYFRISFCLIHKKKRGKKLYDKFFFVIINNDFPSFVLIQFSSLFIHSLLIHIYAKKKKMVTIIASHASWNMWMKI